MPSTPRIFRQLNLIFWICILASLLFILMFYVSVKDQVGSDLVSFLTAAAIVKEGKGGQLYDLSIQFSYQQRIIKDYVITDFLLPFRNLPFFATFFLPLSYLAPLQSYKVYTVFLTGVIFWISRLSEKIFKSSAQKIFLPILSFFYVPNLVSIFMGQSSILILLIFLVIYHFVKQKKYFLSGVISGLILIKFQYILVIPFLLFLVDNKKRFLQGFLASVFLIIFLSTAVSGPGFLADYFPFLIKTETTSFGSRPGQMFSLLPLLGMLPLISKLPFLHLLMINAVLYLGTLLIFMKRVKEVKFADAFAAATFFTIIFSIHTPLHDLSIIFVPILILLNSVVGQRKEVLSRVFIVVGLFFLPIIYLSLFLGTHAPEIALTYPAIGFYLLRHKRTFLANKILP